MVLQKGDHVMKTMLSDTILALCRNTLPYEGEVCVEGLLGITLDNKEIFLVNINETLRKEGYLKPQEKEKEKVRKRKSDAESGEESSSQDEDSDSQKQNGAKRKRRKRRKSKEKEVSEGGGVESDNNSGPDASDHEVSRDSSQRLSRTDDQDSRLEMEQDSRDQDTTKEEIKKEEESDNDDIVFVKEEPHELDDSSCSYGQSQGANYALPGSSQSGDSSQMFGQGDPVALGQLQELAMQLSGDNRNMVPQQPSTSFSSLQSPTGGASDQGTPKKYSGSAVSFRMHPTMGGVYVCDLCGKPFSGLGDFRKHERTHTGERPYQCKACGKRFVRSDHLKIHMRTHTGEKPYRCDICLKQFTQKGNMVSHMRTVHHMTESELRDFQYKAGLLKELIPPGVPQGHPGHFAQLHSDDHEDQLDNDHVEEEEEEEEYHRCGIEPGSQMEPPPKGQENSQTDVKKEML